jgi:hypothetical protein
MNANDDAQDDDLDYSNCQCGPGNYCSWCIANTDELLPVGGGSDE